MDLSRRRATALLTLGVIAALRPRALRAAPTRLPVPGPDLAGCVNAWREPDYAPVVWDDHLVPGCLAWAERLARRYTEGEDRPTHDPAWIGRECWAAGQRDWVEAFTAWTRSADHLPILRLPRAARVGMAGVMVPGTARYYERWFWVLRMEG